MDYKQHKGNLRGQIKNQVERKLYNKHIRAEGKRLSNLKWLLTVGYICSTLTTNFKI